MKSSGIHVCLDYSTLDHGERGGQGRYLEDLLTDYAELADPDFRLTLVGSKNEPSARVAATLALRGWRYEALPTLRLRGAYFVDQVRYLQRLLALNVDVFHCVHHFIPVLFPGKTIITIHGMLFEVFDEYRANRETMMYKRYKWAVQNRVTRIIASSQSTKRDLIDRWRVSPDRISVVPLGYSAAFSTHEVAETAADESTTILAPFNLEPRKNLAALVDAVARLLPKYPNLRLVLFGRAAVTPSRELEFRRLVQERNMAERVECTGFVDDETLSRLYRDASVFVFPSLYEGFGLPVLEAMIRGRCVIAVNKSAMPEVVGDCGLLVANGTAEQIADALDKALADPVLRRKLGAAARERTIAMSARQTALSTYEEYRRLYSAPGAPGIRALRRAIVPFL